MHYRHLIPKIEAALKDTPAVLINGARQTGKSTLVKWLVNHGYPATCYTLDNLETLAAIKADPTTFIRSQYTPLVLDEIQKAPELFPIIKEAIDNHRIPGKFLLTGSANILLLPQLSESLAGRMEIKTLWPLSTKEIENKNDRSFIDDLFAKEFNLIINNVIDRDILLDKILEGGYPEVLTRKAADRRHAWFQSYLTTLLQRDIRDLANIEGLTQIPRLLSLIAARSSSLINYAELSRSSMIPHTSLLRYLTLLQMIFLVHFAPPWSNNFSKRLVKTSKIYINDTGLLAYLLGLDKNRLRQEPHLTGILFENFVVNELKKQLTWSLTLAELFHLRTHSGQEIDIILENKSGECVGIEIKASATISNNDFKNLKIFSDEMQSKFLRGIVLYTGDKILPFGKNLFAVPLSILF